ncbi:MAG TPA: family 1 glycosylhydrolase [Lentimicrobium sp.]|nr:family 1 glycosylhydrolase [Lentimicrobium sp.]
MRKFMFATGIENSYPTIELPDGSIKRVDEMEKSSHYQYWQTDFALTKELGINVLRYGPPFYIASKGPGLFDWSFADETFNALKSHEITPIVDLCHFGVPDWMGNFQNPSFPDYFAEYAEAFARRFPWCTIYTPINEIYIAATFSAQYGWWNERLAADKYFVTALKNLCKANILASKAILKVQPEAVFIQSESAEYYHPEEPSCMPLAQLLNEKRFLSLDLVYGHPISVPMYEYLLENGMTKNEYHWFMNNASTIRCIMGNDYYITNEHLVKADGSTSASGEIFGYHVITHQYFRRYNLPVMHTETNILEPLSVEWLKKQWTNAYQLKQDGVPLLGFTWYSLTDQIDWDTALREDNGNVNKLGLYDLDRKIRTVGKQYRRIIDQWSDVLDREPYGFQI